LIIEGIGFLKVKKIEIGAISYYSGGGAAALGRPATAPEVCRR